MEKITGKKINFRYINPKFIGEVIVFKDDDKEKLLQKYPNHHTEWHWKSWAENEIGYEVLVPSIRKDEEYSAYQARRKMVAIAV